MNSPEDGRSAAPETLLQRSGAAPGLGKNGLAMDFLDLAFQMENGRSLPVMSRFEGPIRVAVTGAMPPSAGHDLTRLIARLRNEAGIDIALAKGGASAEITIAFEPRANLRRLAPTAACFVVPGASSLAEFRRGRGSDAMDWGSLTTRTRAAIFVPSDTSAQEVRDCLHEELAQAIGPLNDLYRLSDSVFNDDNFHTELTDFDIQVLRAYMSPQLRSGMTRAEAAAIVPGLLSRAAARSSGGGAPSPRGWMDAIQAATTSGNTDLTMRRAAAARALAISDSQGWNDTRAAFSHFAVARLEATRDPALAAAEFDRAAQIWSRLPGTGIHLAHIALQRASMALAAGDLQQAIRLADQAMPAVKACRNAALEATGLLIKAEALAGLGRMDEARRLRLDSRALQRYGFAAGSDVEARVHDIAALPRRVASN